MPWALTTTPGCIRGFGLPRKMSRKIFVYWQYGEQEVGEQEAGEQEVGEQEVGEQEDGEQEVGEQENGEVDVQEDLCLLAVR